MCEGILVKWRLIWWYKFVDVGPYLQGKLTYAKVFSVWTSSTWQKTVQIGFEEAAQTWLEERGQSLRLTMVQKNRLEMCFRTASFISTHSCTTPNGSLTNDGFSFLLLSSLENFHMCFYCIQSRCHFILPVFNDLQIVELTLYAL